MAPLLHRWGCRRLLLTAGLVYSAAFSLAALAFSTAGLFAAAAITAGVCVCWDGSGRIGSRNSDKIFPTGSCRQVMSVVVQVAVCRCFQRRRPLAVGVTVAGGSVSQIMVPPLVAFIQSHYNPRTALLMTSVLMLHICVAAALLPSDPKNNAPLRVDYLAMVRRREVALLCMVVALSNATLAVFWATVPLALLDTGHNSHEMALYFSVVGVVTLASRVAIGLLLCHFYQPALVVRLASILAAATIPGECPPHYPLSPVTEILSHPTWTSLTEHHVCSVVLERTAGVAGCVVVRKWGEQQCRRRLNRPGGSGGGRAGVAGGGAQSRLLVYGGSNTVVGATSRCVLIQVYSFLTSTVILPLFHCRCSHPLIAYTVPLF